ncbi:MAG: response regulator [Nitrospinae bacterium]|nr:response regulator [Nitrospinota bacterium]
MYRVMVVDDESNILKSLGRSLAEDYEVETFDSPFKALERANEATFDLVLSDYRMPEMNGVKFLAAFKQRQPNAARLILSGYTDREELVGAINEAEIYRFISKPWEEYELKSTIAQAIAYNGLLMENQALADQVRAQQKELADMDDMMKLTKQELARLEKEHPGLTKLKLDSHGYYISSIQEE